MEPKLSEFGLVEFLIQESHVVRRPIIQELDLNYDIKIKPSGIIQDQHFELHLDVLINEGDQLEVKVIAVGIFQFKGSVTLDNIPNYFIINAPAIIFPYIRAYVATLTAVSGHKTVTIPVINLTGIQEELRKNIEVLSA